VLDKQDLVDRQIVAGLDRAANALRHFAGVDRLTPVVVHFRHHDHLFPIPLEAEGGSSKAKLGPPPTVPP